MKTQSFVHQFLLFSTLSFFPLFFSSLVLLVLSVCSFPVLLSFSSFSEYCLSKIKNLLPKAATETGTATEGGGQGTNNNAQPAPSPARFFLQLSSSISSSSSPSAFLTRASSLKSRRPSHRLNLLRTISSHFPSSSPASTASNTVLLDLTHRKAAQSRQQRLLAQRATSLVQPDRDSRTQSQTQTQPLTQQSSQSSSSSAQHQLDHHAEVLQLHHDLDWLNENTGMLSAEALADIHQAALELTQYLQEQQRQTMTQHSQLLRFRQQQQQQQQQEGGRGQSQPPFKSHAEAELEEELQQLADAEATLMRLKQVLQTHEQQQQEQAQQQPVPQRPLIQPESTEPGPEQHEVQTIQTQTSFPLPPFVLTKTATHARMCSASPLSLLFSSFE